MANHSARIWRTVVFAGAMLATPLAGCAGGTHKATTPVAEDAPPVDTAAAERDAQAKRDADAQEAALQVQRDADAKAAADKAAEDQRLADEEKQRQVEEASARIRGSGRQPVGRGFVLA